MCNDYSDGIGTLFGIGIGPGDPELITLKGMNIIRKVIAAGGTVFTPVGKLKDGSLAKEILLRSGSDVSSCHELHFPMSSDEKVLDEKWKAAAGEVISILKRGKDAAFLTLGDPSVYSTWGYLRSAIKTHGPSFRCVTVPGIQTLNAAAAVHSLTLLEGKERLALLPAPDDPAELNGIISLFDTIVLYKVGHRLPEIREFITDKNLAGSSYYTERVGLPGEIIAKGLNNLSESASGYLSAIIIKTGRIS